MTLFWVPLRTLFLFFQINLSLVLVIGLIVMPALHEAQASNAISDSRNKGLLFFQINPFKRPSPRLSGIHYFGFNVIALLYKATLMIYQRIAFFHCPTPYLVTYFSQFSLELEDNNKYDKNSSVLKLAGSGWKWSAKSKKKSSETKKGKPHPHKGHPHTEESKRKISMANRGKPKPPLTPEQARKLSEARSGPNNPNYGKKFSNEIRQKMRESHARARNGRRGKGKKIAWNKGIALSAEHRKNIAKARKGKPHPHK
jgi:hypothetical protein